MLLAIKLISILRHDLRLIAHVLHADSEDEGEDENNNNRQLVTLELDVDFLEHEQFSEPESSDRIAIFD